MESVKENAPEEPIFSPTLVPWLNSKMLTIVLTILAVAACLFLILDFSKPHNFPPGPPSLPIWGAYWFLLALDYKSLANAFVKIGKFYRSNILGMFLGPFPAVIINNYEGVREMLFRHDMDGRVDAFVARLRSFNKKLGVFFTDGEYWHAQRRFALRYMRDFGFGRRCPTLEGVLENEIKEMIDLCVEGPIHKGEDTVVRGNTVLMPNILAVPFINGMLSVLTRSTLNRDQHFRLREVSAAAVKFLRSGDDLGLALSLTPWLKDVAPHYSGYSALFESNMEIVNFFQDILKDLINTHSGDEDRHFVDLFLKRMNLELERDGHSTFSEEQLLLTCVDFTFPAASATGILLSMLVDHMLVNPEIQHKVHKEIDRVVGRDRLPTIDDRQNMPYLEACIRETLRFETMVEMGLPHRVLEDTTICGYNIPEGTMIAGNMKAVHHDEQMWPEPDTFKPERFIDESGNLCLKKDKSLPFGAGRRLCAGETYARNSMFQVFAGFMQAFKISTVDGKPQKKLRIRMSGFATSIDDFWVKLTPRKSVEF